MVKSELGATRAMLGDGKHFPSYVFLNHPLFLNKSGERTGILQVQSDFMAAHVQQVESRSGRERTATKEDIRPRAVLVEPTEHGLQFRQKAEPIDLGKVQV
jgi:hypothetical protein